MNITKLASAVEAYLADLRRIRALGGATADALDYLSLTDQLNATKGMLKSKLFCVDELGEQGAGHPDCNLYAASQVQYE